MFDSFVLELQLQVFEKEASILDTRFISGGMLYNGCLQECLKRCDLMKQSQQYQKARKLPKKNPERSKLFKEAKELYKFNEYKIHV